MKTTSVLGLLCCAGAAAAQGWPMFQGDAGHSGYLPVAIDPSRIVHRFDVHVALVWPLNAVAVAQGRVFVSDQAGLVNAYDASTGAQLWSHDFGQLRHINPPSHDGHTVYVQTADWSGSYLRGYDAATGQQRFQTAYADRGLRYFAPTIRDGVVYAPAGSYGGIAAFDADSGLQRWYTALPEFELWTPTVDADTVYCHLGDTLYALDRSNGSERYRIVDPHYVSGAMRPSAPIHGGRDDVVSQQGGRLLRFDLLGHRVDWEMPIVCTGQPALHDGVIYACTDTGLQARAQTDGTLLWSWARSGLSRGVIVTDSHVLVRTETTLYLVDRQTHASVWSTPATGYVALGEGAIYIARADGHLDCHGFAALPALAGIDPAQLPFAQPPTPVVVHGTGFSFGQATRVLFDDTAATDVSVINDTTLSCVPPAHGPGFVDVRLENSIGHAVLARSFAFVPAVGLAGDRQVGTTAVVALVQQARQPLVLGYGFGPPLPAPVTVPPFAGGLQIAQPELLLMLPFWATARLDLPLPIPSDPSLVGGRFVFQSLAGSSIESGDAAFSNCVELVIR